jgi:hypothetical protein
LGSIIFAHWSLQQPFGRQACGKQPPSWQGRVQVQTPGASQMIWFWSVQGVITSQ